MAWLLTAQLSKKLREVPINEDTLSKRLALSFAPNLSYCCMYDSKHMTHAAFETPSFTLPLLEAYKEAIMVEWCC